MLTLSECFDNECEAQEGHEHDVEFVEATEAAAEALEPAEPALDLASTPIPGFAVRPGRNTRRAGRDDGTEAQIERELSGFIAFIRRIHDEAAATGQSRQVLHEFATGGCITCLDPG